MFLNPCFPGQRIWHVRLFFLKLSSTLIEDSSVLLIRHLRNFHYHLLIGSLCITLFVLSGVRSVDAAEQLIVLNNTWSEYDPFLQGLGKQTLTNNTAIGFTATLAAGPVSSEQEVPRNYQEFTPLDMSLVGQKITASFDVIFNAIPDINDSDFRFGFGDTISNQGMVPIMVDMGDTGDTGGDPTGTSTRMRYDASITDEATSYTAGDYSGFLSASGTFSSGSGTPAGTGIGGGLEDTTTTHSFTATMERVERNVDTTFPDPDGVADTVVEGFYTTMTWTNDLMGATTFFKDIDDPGFGGFDVDNGLGVWNEILAENGSIDSIDSLGFTLFATDPFIGAGGGGYTISNFELVYDDGILSGDFNDDGTVDAADYTVWRDNLGGDALTLNGKGDGDGNVDSLDYDIWVANYGTGSSSATSAAVPEPSSLLIMVSATLLVSGMVRSRYVSNI